MLEQILNEFRFVIINFHSDNGGEYINHTVAKLLNKLHIELTKSRARHSNDNALAETKNGSIVRKYLGYMHIPQKWAPTINKFSREYLIPYINFHRPCHFPEIKTNKKGKIIKVYPYENMMTPYEKLKALDNADQYLKPGITFAELDNIAMAMTDLQAAQLLQQEQKALFKQIFQSEGVC